jgi:hypothetical protein
MKLMRHWFPIYQTQRNATQRNATQRGLRSGRVLRY